MRRDATTVEEYLEQLTDDQRIALQAVRETILRNLPEGYEEGIQYGMIGYFVPHSIYPSGYHCDPQQPLPFAHLAAQKNHMAVYLMCIYSDPKQEQKFREDWLKTGKKLDMGKSCIRFKKLDDVPLPVIGRAIKRAPVAKYIGFYEKATVGRKKRSTKKKT